MHAAITESTLLLLLAFVQEELVQLATASRDSKAPIERSASRARAEVADSRDILLQHAELIGGSPQSCIDRRATLDVVVS